MAEPNCFMEGMAALYSDKEERMCIHTLPKPQDWPVVDFTFLLDLVGWVYACVGVCACARQSLEMYNKV